MQQLSSLEIIVTNVFERFILDRFFAVPKEHGCGDFLLDFSSHWFALLINWLHFVLRIMKKA